MPALLHSAFLKAAVFLPQLLDKWFNLKECLLHRIDLFGRNLDRLEDMKAVFSLYGFTKARRETMMSSVICLCKISSMFPTLRSESRTYKGMHTVVNYLGELLKRRFTLNRINGNYIHLGKF